MFPSFYFSRYLRSLKCPQYLDRAMEVCKAMLDTGLEPTIVTYTILISRYFTKFVARLGLVLQYSLSHHGTILNWCAFAGQQS